MNMNLTERYFAIEDGAYYKGYENGKRWNGWACPLFEKSVADKICSIASDNETISIEYDKQKDTYSIKSLDNSFEDDFYEGKDYEIDGQIKHLYPIGSGLWCWDSYKKDEVYKGLRLNLDELMRLVEIILLDAPEEGQCGKKENELYEELANVFEFKDSIDDILAEKINTEIEDSNIELSEEEPDISE